MLNQRISYISPVLFKYTNINHRKLKSGGFGSVVRGSRKGDGTPVAIKRISRAKGHEIAVYKEVVIMSKLKDHKFIISFHDFFQDDQLYYIVMDYREGGDLRDGIKT